MPLHTLRRGALYFSVPCLHARAHPKGASTWRGVPSPPPRGGRRLDAQPSCTYGHIRLHIYYFIPANGLLQSHVAVLFFFFFSLLYTTLFFINRTALDETCSALHVHRITSQWGQNLYVVAIKYLDL